MATFRLPESDYIDIPSGAVRGKFRGLPKDKAALFSPQLLGLGDLSKRANVFTGICAFFDLQGFTFFTGQRDPELSIPKFISRFVQWFFDRIRKESIHEEVPEGYLLWHKFPLFIKFLGDGFMTVWDTSQLHAFQETNIVESCDRICQSYIAEFRPTIVEEMSDSPRLMRCGVAKGRILSVGDEADFVGPVVNLAARLQKLPGFTFAWSSKGFDLDEPTKMSIKRKWILIKATISDWANSENVYVPQSDYEELPEEQKNKMKVVSGDKALS